MKSASWKDVTELVAIIAILASLVFVGLQLSQAEVIARSEINFAILDTQIEVSNAISAHPDVWAKGNSGENLQPAEAIIFSEQIRNLNNFFYATVRYSDLMDLDWKDSDLSQFAAFLYENPGARQVWRDREDRLKVYRGLGDPGEVFTSDWVNAIEAKLDVFDQASKQ
jgi:hypothetical protein